MLPYKGYHHLYTTFMVFVWSVCVCVREREKDLTQMGYNLSITICLEEDASFSWISGFYIYKVGMTIML